MDFIIDLPSSKGFDSILTVVDRFTKMAHFLLCTKTINSQETTDLVMRCRGYPRGCVEVGQDHGVLEPRNQERQEGGVWGSRRSWDHGRAGESR